MIALADFAACRRLPAYKDSRSSILPLQFIQVGRCEESFLVDDMRQWWRIFDEKLELTST